MIADLAVKSERFEIGITETARKLKLSPRVVFAIVECEVAARRRMTPEEREEASS